MDKPVVKNLKTLIAKLGFERFKLKKLRGTMRRQLVGTPLAEVQVFSDMQQDVAALKIQYRELDAATKKTTDELEHARNAFVRRYNSIIEKQVEANREIKKTKEVQELNVKHLGIIDRKLDHAAKLKNLDPINDLEAIKNQIKHNEAEIEVMSKHNDERDSSITELNRVYKTQGEILSRILTDPTILATKPPTKG